MDKLMWVILVGVLATAMLDLWTLLRQRIFATPLPNYALVGRWFAHMPGGRFRHASIIKATPVAAERLIGWIAHYAIGVVFAALIPALWGSAWMSAPTLAPALMVGLSTVIAPLLVMQPAMGTAKPPGSPQWRGAALQSLFTHLVFGLGLYVAARLVTALGMGS